MTAASCLPGRLRIARLMGRGGARWHAASEVLGSPPCSPWAARRDRWLLCSAPLLACIGCAGALALGCRTVLMGAGSSSRRGLFCFFMLREGEANLRLGLLRQTRLLCPVARLQVLKLHQELTGLGTHRLGNSPAEELTLHFFKFLWKMSAARKPVPTSGTGCLFMGRGHSYALWAEANLNRAEEELEHSKYAGKKS
eukprot:1150852-Pelagomonas_calceolata.AAC.9